MVNDRRRARGGLRSVAAPPDHDARGLAWLAAILGTASVGLGAVLAATGQAWPSLGLLVVFAVLAWFAVNRYTFFPSELAVTSESAVLLAAVIAFRHDAPYLGPWCVAALVGPLDAVHWEHRAFSRMGFNAAHQMLAVVAAAAAYAAVDARGDATTTTAAAAIAAIAVYATVVWVAGVAVLRVWSRLRLGVAVRQLLALDWVVVPLGVVGVLAGTAALEHGWWALPLVLVPTAFVPELVLAHGRSFAAALAASPRVRVLAVASAGALLLGPVAALSVGASALVPLGVVWLACVVAVELRTRQRALVPPLAGIVIAVAAGALGAPAWSSPVRTVGAFGAGLLVAGAATLTAPVGARRFELTRLGWALPLFSVAVGSALAVPRFGAAAVAVPLVIVPATAVLVTAWAAPPWSSALLAAALAPRRWALRRVALGSLVVVGVAAAACGARASDGARRAGFALVALTAIELALAVAAVGARQWRLDPRRRRVVGPLVAVTAVTALIALPLLARHEQGWTVVTATVAAAVALVVGDAPARLGDVAGARRRRRTHAGLTRRG